MTQRHFDKKKKLSVDILSLSLNHVCQMVCLEECWVMKWSPAQLNCILQEEKVLLSYVIISCGQYYLVIEIPRGLSYGWLGFFFCWWKKKKVRESDLITDKESQNFYSYFLIRKLMKDVDETNEANEAFNESEWSLNFFLEKSEK